MTDMIAETILVVVIVGFVAVIWILIGIAAQDGKRLDALEKQMKKLKQPLK